MGRKCYRVNSGRNREGRKRTDGNRPERIIPENERQATVSGKNEQREKGADAEIPYLGGLDDSVRAETVREIPAGEIAAAVFPEIVPAVPGEADAVSPENRQAETGIARHDETSLETGPGGFPALDAVPAAVFPGIGTGSRTYPEEGTGIFGGSYYGVKAGYSGKLSGGAGRQDGQPGVTRAEIEALLDEKLSALRVYVLESDITQAQNAVKSVVELATF